MRFDDSVLDLYVNILHLNDIGTVLDGYWQRDVDPPTNLRSMADVAALAFKESERKALLNVPNRDVLSQQLSFIDEHKGIA